MVEENSLGKAIRTSAKSIYRTTPILVGVTLLISLVSSLVSPDSLVNFFGKNDIFNTFIATVLGSIFAGNPINSYIIGGEFLSLGLGLVAVTSFLIAWVTVGIVQLPAEMMMLGKKFAITRNVISFIFSIIISLIISGIVFIGVLI